MKVLIVNTLYHPHKIGGAEVSVQLLAEGLVKAGHEVRVVSLHDQNVKKIDRVNGVEVSYLPLFNKYWPYSDYVPTKLEKLVWHLLDTYNIVMSKRIESELLEFKPDVVHTNNIAGFSVAVWSIVNKHKIPLVHTSRDYYLHHPNSTLFKKGKIQSTNDIEVKLWSFIKRKASKKVTSYVGISKFILDFHLNEGFFNNKNADFIYNPIEKVFVNKEKPTKCVGFIGRLSEDKGFDVFCDIAKKNRTENIKFIAAGKFPNGSEGDQLKKIADEANVELLGFINFKSFISQVDSVVLPIKWNEPFGRVVVESALAGVNVYTNKIGGVAELFDFFDNIYEIKEFSSNVKQVVKKNITMDFNIKKNVELYVLIYEKVLKDET
ncbi:glycosyltransferase family 4 protein [Acinetobacter sp. YH12252]|uniref:glycosyltransferase family 4 protein n=1 Tax=Acinetobacter sp. YH12252 TaxID=2601177 RepID=UPI0015D27A64|nr:glycosyltransferase family 4 protein [Acinetobacter sp. YH12252]